MYQYDKMRSKLFTEEGVAMFLDIRDHTRALLKTAGAITLEAAIRGARGGDSWLMLACVDRLVELGEISEILYPEQKIQNNRIFISRSG